MNFSQKAWIQVLFIPLLWLAACTPVEDTHTASISGGVYCDCNQDGKCAESETGIPNMKVRLYFGACGENMLQTHLTDKEGEFMFSGLAAGEYCVFPDFKLKTCGYGGNAPTTPISQHVTLENGMKAEHVLFGFGNLSGDAEP